MFNAPLVTAVDPKMTFHGEWSLCSPNTAPNYSAVAFFFALKLHQELGVPVGVIKTAWGGQNQLKRSPAVKRLLRFREQSVCRYGHQERCRFRCFQGQARYEQSLANWEALVAAERKKPAADRKKLANRTVAPEASAGYRRTAGRALHSMIHPFVGYTMRGAIWYQGESNAKPGAVPYDQTLPLMIRDWRQRWDDEFSFYFVQLANYRKPSTAPGTLLISGLFCKTACV